MTPEKFFDASELEAHKLLTDIRADTVAHFGPGGSYAGPAWQVDGVFGVEFGDGGLVLMTASRRLILSAFLIQTVSKQISRAVILSARNVHKLNQEAALAFGKSLRRDPPLLQALVSRQIREPELIGFSGIRQPSGTS